MTDDQRDPRTYAIIGAAMEVHRELGAGFLETVYAEALAIEFELRGVPFRREVPLNLSYKDQPLQASYRSDFMCFDGAIIVEIKALKALTAIEEAQIINYLNATGIETGLLLNFGEKSLNYKRFIRTRNKPSAGDNNL